MTKADRPLSQRPTARALRAAVARSGMTYPQIAKAIGMNPETLRDWCFYRPLTIYDDEPAIGKGYFPGERVDIHDDFPERFAKATNEAIYVGTELWLMWYEVSPETPAPNPLKYQTFLSKNGFEPEDIENLEISAESMDLREGLFFGTWAETAYELLSHFERDFAERWAPSRFDGRYEWFDSFQA